MTPRKPLPYHALQSVDDAIMENEMAVKSLAPIILDENPMNMQELFRLVGKGIYHVQRSTGLFEGNKQGGRRSWIMRKSIVGAGLSRGIITTSWD